MFDTAKWIWNKNAIGTDCYTEFFSKVELKKGVSSKIRISVDSNYALYINGAFVESGQYADYFTYKFFDEIDIEKYIVEGENSIAIIVWYYGLSSFTYSVAKPGLIFEIEQNDKIIFASDTDVLSRKSNVYISNKNEYITSQLGLTFHIDLTNKDNWMIGASDGFEKSVVCADMPSKIQLRPIKKLKIGETVKGKLINQGCFNYFDTEGDFGAKMQHAAISFYYKEELLEAKTNEFIAKNKLCEGLFFIVDLESESAGYLDFDLEVPDDCEMEIGWGEHLVDGRCRTKISARNFSCTVKLKAGKNTYMNPFRRLGCRYLQVFVHSERVKVGHIGLRPTTYPLNIKEYKSGNILRDTIYKVCENTLIQCMHEHYEDCPWREQSFYTLDSRNQMLCGYYAFGEYEYVKANLKLFSKAIKEDGLLTICSHSDGKLKIPSFCLFYIVQLTEYYRYSKDADTIKFCFDTAKKIVDTFADRIDDTGLTPNFEGKAYWNFYEWQPNLDGRDNNGKQYDTCLNTVLSIALEHFVELCDVTGIDSKHYFEAKQKLNENIKEKLFNSNIGLFGLTYGKKDNCISVLANALGFLSGAVNKEESENIFELISTNECSVSDLEIIPATLSMNTFRYEALIKADKERYANIILDEIDKIYLNMLRNGATSFWETVKGDADFHNAGSLCHGWSAMPIYYYETLFSKGNKI